jgi:hypothetical protein
MRVGRKKQTKTEKARKNESKNVQSVPFNVELDTVACRSSLKKISYNAEHSRRMKVDGFRVTWDSLYKERRKERERDKVTCSIRELPVSNLIEETG